MKKVKITTTATVINTDAQQTQRMTSLEIAELTGKQHKNVMQAIRNMEPALEKTCGLKFQLTSRTIIQPNGGTRRASSDRRVTSKPDMSPRLSHQIVPMFW